MLKSPIKIDLIRPLDAPKTPYGRCERCQYVSIDLVSNGVCPICNANCQQGYTIWPDPGLEELWYDEVAMWNQQKLELAVVTAAMYFEASVFHLVYWGTGWLDDDLKWIGCGPEEFPEKQKRIWSFLCEIKTREKTDEVLKKLFKATGKEMLKKVLGNDDADSFWEEYRKLSDYRNDIVHKGRRSLYRRDDGSIDVVHEPKFEDILNWCLRFIPICWVVFSKMHNKFIHKPMWRRKQ